MKKYTIGALFTEDFLKVLLIKKKRPAWQAGMYNLPGGHIEDEESWNECVSREFMEEAGVLIPPDEWYSIGQINNDGNYYVGFLTAIYKPEKHGQINFNASDEEVMWCDPCALPDNAISNLFWLVPFAINTHSQGNVDNIVFGKFEYVNK